jgi:glycosyltransferase involved in cell wall biosynthesis
MIKKEVSIVITFFNKSNTIHRAIESVIEQSFLDWEIIIVDDCSEEKLNLDKYLNFNQIRVIRNKINLGAAQSRQVGLENSVSKYVAFLDADDWWANSFLAIMVKELNENEDSAGCYGLIQEVRGEVVSYRNKYFGLTSIRETVIGYYRPWQTSGILWRKKLVGSWGNLKTREDAWFEITTSLNNNNLLFVKDAICYVDKSGDNHLSLKNKKLNSALNHLELFIMIYNECWKVISFKQKGILINRIFQSFWAIKRLDSITAKKQLLRLKKLNKTFFILESNSFIVRGIIKVLQFSLFKVRV